MENQLFCRRKISSQLVNSTPFEHVVSLFALKYYYWLPFTHEGIIDLFPLFHPNIRNKFRYKLITRVLC